MPPQTNATVTALAGQGSESDWDEAAVAGAAKWAGEVRAYYRETTDRVRGESTGTVDVVIRRELILDYADVDALGLDTDDVLTFRVDGEDEDRTAEARVIPRKLLGRIPRHLQTSRIVLSDA